MRFEATQYTASPEGKASVQNPNITGIIQFIMLVVDCCLGSRLGVAAIFWTTHMLPPTNRGMMIGLGSGSPRSIHRKVPLSGTASSTIGSQE